jgi:hypothetical protein
MIPEKRMFPRNCPVIVIIDTQIQKNIQDKSKIEQGEVKAVHFLSDPVLHSHLNTEEPEWFDKQIQDDEQGQIGDKSLFQTDFN